MRELFGIYGQSTGIKFWRDDRQGGTFGETINNESLMELQSINKGGTFREMIDKGKFQRDNQMTRKAPLERRLTRVNFKRDNQLTRGAFLGRLNNTGTVLLMVSLLLVKHCWPSHIQYALYLFISCSIDEGYFPREDCFV